MEKSTQRTKVDLIFELLKDPDRKNIFKIIGEVGYLFFIFKSFPRHYFARYLFKKGQDNIKDYFPDKILNKVIKPQFNNKEVIDVLENKLFFNFYYSQFNISLPRILMYNHKKIFVIGNKNQEVSNINDFKNIVEELFKQNLASDSIFIKKTYWSFGGDGVYKLYRDQISSGSASLNELFSEVIKTGFIFQETVKQHADLNKLNPSCLNTIRFDTFIDAEGKIDIISGYIRMSTVNNHIDNITSGGCQVGVNLQTGKLKKDGYFTISSRGVLVVKEHPVTKIVFEGFSIPLFNEAKALVIKTAGFMPELRLVGWDVAIGESGPVLIEGNSNYDMQGNDLADGGYRANPVFRKVLKEINYK